MDEHEWGVFCELLSRVVNLPGKTWSEKRDAVVGAFEEHGSPAEFVGWFEGEVP